MAMTATSTRLPSANSSAGLLATADSSVITDQIMPASTAASTIIITVSRGDNFPDFISL
jgi:hypothetical protein